MVKGTTTNHAQSHERRRRQQQQQQQRRVLKENAVVTDAPTNAPTAAPTRRPTPSPVAPTMAPVAPTRLPTKSPTPEPTSTPTTSPTSSPTATLTSLAPTSWESQWTQHVSLLLSARSTVDGLYTAASTREHLSTVLTRVVCDAGALMVDREQTNVCLTLSSSSNSSNDNDNNRNLQLVIPSSTVLWQEPSVVIASCPEELDMDLCFSWNFTYSVIDMGDQQESDLQSALDAAIQNGSVNDDVLQGTGIVTSVVGQEQSLILSTNSSDNIIPDGVAVGLQFLGGFMMVFTCLFGLIVTRWARLRRTKAPKHSAPTVPMTASPHGLQSRDGVEAMLLQSRPIVPTTSSTGSSTASQSTTMASNINMLERQHSGRSLSSSEDRLVSMAKQATQAGRFPGSSDAPIRALLPVPSTDEDDNRKADDDDEEDCEDILFITESDHTHSSAYGSAVSVLTGTETTSRAPTPVQLDHWSTLPSEEDESSLPTPTTSEVDA